VKNLHYVDRTAMANAIETRVPFLDHRLIECAATLPREYKISPTLKTKRILKDAYKEVLPSYILDRRKAGFGMPLRSLLAQQKVLDKLLSLEFFASIPGFDVDNIKQVIANQINGKEEGSALLFALISFQHWHKKTFE
jgi:asparagine synthase (glutamine-hydrolysing)